MCHGGTGACLVTVTGCLTSRKFFVYHLGYELSAL